MSLREILDNPNNNFIISINGNIVPCEQWELTFPAADDLVLIQAIPEGDSEDSRSAWRIIAMIGILFIAGWAAPALAGTWGLSEAFWTSAILFAGTVAVSLLLPPILPDQDNGQTKSAYSLTGSRNKFAPYETIPILYGRHRLYPPIAAVPYTELIGDDQYLNMVYCVGLGEYEIDADSIKIGDTAISQYNDVVVGLSTAPVLPDIFEEQLTINLNQSDEPGDSYIRTSASDTYKIGVDIAFPAGLIAIQKDGDKRRVEVHFSIEYREVGTSTWNNVIFTDWREASRVPSLDAYNITQEIIRAWGFDIEITPEQIEDATGAVVVSGWNGNWFKVGAMNRDAIRSGIVFNVPHSGSWEVRITRQRTSFKTNGADSRTELTEGWDQITANMLWTALRSYQVGEAINLESNIATFLIARIRATDQLRGVIDTLNLVATRKLPAWSKGTQSFIEKSPTRSPAWAFIDVLTGLGNARPIEAAQIENKIDLDTLADWAQACSDKGIYYDEVIDYNTSVFDALTRIASVGRAALSNRDGKWTVIQEVQGGTPVQYFTPRNSWNFASTKRFVDYPHALRVRFNSEQDDYQQTEIKVYDDNYNSGNATLFETVELAGITNPDQAWKTGRYLLASTRLRPEIYTFEADVEHIIAQRGDHILMSHDIPLWGSAYGRITEINGNQVTIDEAAMLYGGKSYRMRVRRRDGTSVIEDLSPQGGETYSHTFTPSIPPDINIGDLVMIGEVGSETQELVVLSIEPTSDLNARITCVDHNDAILTADTGIIPPYNPNITLPVTDITQVSPAPPYNLRARSEQNSFPSSADTRQSPRINISWELVAGAQQRWAALYGDIRYREYDDPIQDPNGAPGPWQYIPIFDAFHGTAYIENTEPDNLYEIQIRTRSQWDQVSPWTQSIFHQAGGITIVPPSVDGMTTTSWIGGVVLNVDFTSVQIRNAAYIEVTYGTVNNRLDAGATTEQLVIPQDLFPLGTLRFFIDFNDTTTRFFWVRLIDIYGMASAWFPVSDTAGVSGTPLQSTAVLYYIKPITGTAIKNGVGTLTIEAHRIDGSNDVLLSSGTIQLYDELNQIVNVANGYVAGSDGYTGILNSGNINGDIVITLKDGVGGTPLDTITLVDIADGGSAVYGYIEAIPTLAWSRQEDGVTWSPTNTSTQIDVTFVQDGADVARWARTINRSAAGLLTDGGAADHTSTNLNIGTITPSFSGAGTQTLTIEFTYTDGVNTVSVGETVLTSVASTIPLSYYIKPTNGTAIRNGVGTLTVEARRVDYQSDTLLSSGTIQLYDELNQIVNVANGYVTGSDGYTGILAAANIDGDKIITLKDGVGGTPLDTITLVDIADGGGSVYGFIEPENGLAWRRAGTSGAWTPSQLTTDLDVTFVKDGADVARQGYRITLNEADGTLTGATTPHPLTDLNTGNITITPSGSGTSTMSVKFDYASGADATSISETVVAVMGGSTGIPGQFTVLQYDDLDTTQLAAGPGRYAMLTAVGTNTSGSQNNFQNTDGILINKADTGGINFSLFLSEIREGDRIVYKISNTRWYAFSVTDTEFGIVGSGSAEAYKLDVSLLEYEDSDPTVTVPTTAGTNVTFEVHRSLYDISKDPIIDPDFDLSTALTGPTGTISSNDTITHPGNANFWAWSRESSETGGTFISYAFPTITLESNGVNGSRSIKWAEVIYGPEGGNTLYIQELYLWHVHRFRTNTPNFTVKIRARNVSANGEFSLNVRIRGFTQPRGGSTVDFTDVGDAYIRIPASTANYTEFVTHISSSTASTAQYWQLHISHIRNTGSGGFTAGDIRQCEIDSIFVEQSSKPFGSVAYTGSTDRPSGLVPASASGDVGKFLKADGTWDTPVPGTTPNSFPNMAVTDTDSGHTWSATGTAVADTSTDTLTFVSGTGINVDVSPTTDAIRITNTSPGIASVSADTSPALGGNLNPSGFNMTGSLGTTVWTLSTSGSLRVSSDGTGRVELELGTDFYLESNDGTTTAIHNHSNSDYRESVTGTRFSTLERQFLGYGLVKFGSASAQAPLFIYESAAGKTQQTGYGQIWVKNDTPNTLMYTDDAGNSYDIIGGLGGLDWTADQGASNIHPNNFGAGANFADSTVDGALMSDFAVEHQAVAAIASTTIDYLSGQSVTLTMGAVNITTLIINNWPTTGLGQLQLEIVQGATARTITWPGAITWINGTAPDLTGVNRTYLIQLSTRNGGTNVLGSYAKDASVGGESNTASNVGTDGVGVFRQKTGPNLEFRHVAPGSTKVTTTLNVQDIDIDIVEANINHDALLNFSSTEHFTQAQITTVGTITTGVWNGTALTANFVPNHDSLNGFVAAEHIDWTADAGASNLHPQNFGAGADLAGEDIEHFAVQHQLVTASTASTAIDLALGQSVTLDLNASTTISFSNVPTTGLAQVEILILQDATARTITWPTSTVWGGGAPDISTINAQYLVHLSKRPTGAQQNWVGTFAGSLT